MGSTLDFFRAKAREEEEEKERAAGKAAPQTNKNSSGGTTQKKSTSTLDFFREKAAQEREENPQRFSSSQWAQTDEPFVSTAQSRSYIGDTFQRLNAMAETARNAAQEKQPTIAELSAQLLKAQEEEKAARNATTKYRGYGSWRYLTEEDIANQKAAEQVLADKTAQRQKLQAQIEALNDQRRYGDKTYDDNFFGQFGANYTQGRLQQDSSLAWNDYLNDPSEANKLKATAAAAVLEEFQRNNEEALADDATASWLSQSLAGYLPQFMDQAKYSAAGAALGGTLGSGIPVLGTAAGIKAGIVAGSGKYSYDTMRGAAYQGLIEAGMDEETAKAAASDEAIVSALIEMADTGVDIATLGVGKLINLVGKGGVKAVAGEAAETATKKFLKGLAGYGLNIGGEMVEEASQEAVSIANENRDTTGIWDLAKSAVGTAWDAARGEDEESAQRIWQAAQEGGKIAAMMGGATRAATGIANTAIENRTGAQMRNAGGDETVEALIESGLESAEGTESRVLAEKLKAKQEAGQSVSNTEVGRLYQANVRAMEAEEQAAEPVETLEQVAREATQAEQEVPGEGITQPTQEEKPAREPLKAEQSVPYNVMATNNPQRKAVLAQQEKDDPGYGKTGTATFRSIVEDSGRDVADVRAEFQSAYEAGMTNLPRELAALSTPVQEEAYNAGRQDYILSMSRENKGATVYGKEAGFIRSDASVDLDARTVETFQAMGKSLGAKIMMEQQVYGGKANGSYSDGVIRIAKDAANPYVVVAKHEVTHRMQDLAPKEYTQYRDYAVQVLSSERSSTGTTLVEAYQDRAAEAGVRLTAEQAMDEIAADFTEKILTDEKSLHDFVTHTKSSSKAREMGRKFFQAVREFINKVKRVFKGDKAKMDSAAKAEFGATIEQLEKAERLWKEAYRAAEKSAHETGRAVEGRGKIETQYSVKEAQPNGRERKETRAEFLRRAAGSGYAVFEGKATAYGYREVPGRRAQQNARQVREEVKKLGIDAVIFEGPIRYNENGVTKSHVCMEAVTIDKSRIFINNRATVSPRNLAGHEAFHLWYSGVGRDAYVKTIEDNLRFNSKEFKKFLTAVAETYLGNKPDMTQAEKLREEFFAYVSGDIHEGVYDDSMRRMFVDYDAVKAAWNELVAKNIGKQYSLKPDTTAEQAELSDANTRYSLRAKEPPKKVGIAYKVFFAKDGQLYPPMVANPGGAGTPVGVWLDADVGVAAAPSKTGRPQVKAGGKGTQGGSGSLAFRPGWHLGDLPLATQFNRKNPETGKKELFPADFVWAECEYAMDHDYQDEAMSYGYTENGKFRHSYAGLPRLPEDGYYRYRTNPNPDTVPWVITGAMRVKRILTDAETDKILRDAGVEPLKRQGGPIDLARLGLTAGETVKDNKKYSLKDSEGNKLSKEQQDFFKDSKVRDEKGNLMVMYHGTPGGGFTTFDPEYSDDRTSLFFTSSLHNAASYSGTYDIWEEGKGDAPANYGVYLNLTKPLIIYAKDANFDLIRYYTDEMKAMEERSDELIELGHSLDRDDPRRADAFAESDAILDELDEMDEWNGDTKDTRFIAKWAKDRGYDGVIIHDVVDYAAMMDVPVESATVAIAFRADQVKNISNKKPSGDKDIRFSLKSPVEETKTLIALHNLTDEKLRKALALGGFPMPSIAVTRMDIPHTNFGDITLVMNKSTVDPKASRKNTVYSADAWTPTFPQVEYEADPKAQKKLSDLYYNLAKTHGYDLVKPLYGYAQYLDDELSRQGGVEGIIERLVDSNDMKQVYLAAHGKQPIETIYRENVIRMNEHDIERYDHMIDRLGKDVVNELVTRGDEKPIDARKRWAAEHGEELKAAYRAYLTEVGGIEESVADDVMANIKIGELLREVTAARRYLANGPEKVETVEDRAATNAAIQAAVDQGEYEAWLDELFGSAVKDTGISNNKPIFTDSGNRRSFKQTHYPVTLENIAKAMAGQNGGNSKHVTGFVGIKSLRAGTAVRFKSIAHMHELEGRLKHLTQEEADAINDALADRLSDITRRIYNKKKHGQYDNEFMEYDVIGEILMEVCELDKYTVDSIQKHFSQYQYNLGNQLAADVRDLLFDVTQMPVNIFEAKPERAVRFDEVLAAVLPDNADQNLRKQLEQMGLNVLTYKYGDEASRIEAVNSVEGAKFSLKGQSDLLAENAKLREVNQQLRDQFKVTKFAKVDKKALDGFAKRLLKDYASGADINETRDALDTLYTYIANGENGESPVWNEAYKRAYETAVSILEASSAMDDEMYHMYKGLRDRLRTVGISISEEYSHDLGGYEDLNDFRKRNFGRLKIAKDGLPVDVLYQDLANTYPELFDADEYPHPADQLVHIADVLDDLRPVEVNPYSHNMRENATWLANDIMERFFDLPQAKPTFADKAEQKLVKQGIRDAKKLERVRIQKDEKIKKIIEQNREKVKAAQAKEREKRTEAVKKVKEHYKAKESKASDNKKRQVMRAKILRHTTQLSKKLLHASDRNHIPQELQGIVAKLLESINMESNYTYDSQTDSYKKNDLGSPSLRSRLFANLRKTYGELANQLTIDPDLLGDDGLLAEVIGMADLRMADMTLPELETVWKAIRAIEASIQSADITFNQSRWGTISEAANALRAENADKKEMTELDGPGGSLGKLQKLTGIDMMTPEAYFHRLGKSGDALFRLMRDAQDDHIRKMKAVSDFAHEALKGVNVKKLENQMHTVKLGGQDVKLSTAQIMELYVLLNREQAREHIMLGGILPDVVSKGGLKKISRAEPVRGVQMSELLAAFRLLSEEQIAVAKKLQDYASTELSKWGNEAAMKVYNYEKFGEKAYWPIRVNKQEVQSNVQKDTQVTSVAGRGFTKGTKPHANNSVRIGSIFDTFATHSSEMATYAAWLAPMEDINRIRNYTFKEAGATTGTVKGIIDRVHGKNGTTYLAKLMADLSNGVKGTHGETAYMSALVGNYKAASVGANLRVIIQQPTAILRALDMIGPQYFVGTKNPLSGWKKAKQYAPIAQWKDWGYFDINTGRQMKDVLFDSDSALDKVKSASMWGAGAADSLSWGILWNAVETETRHKHKDLKGEDFYKAVAERFNEIVDHTQVVDGILQRSQIMRSADGLTKMATSFMGEPTKQYNMMMGAAYDATHGNRDQRRAGKKRLMRAAVTLTISGVANAMAQAIMDAVRDDDREKDYWEKWFAQLTGVTGDEETTGELVKNVVLEGNLGGTFNPATYIPFVKDIVSIIQGYDVSRMDMESIEKTLTASKNMIQALSGEGKYTIGSASAALFAEVARMAGVPVANLKREVKSFAMLAANETDNYLMQYRMEKAALVLNYSSNKKTFMDILYRAYKNDPEAYEIIRADMIAEDKFGSDDQTTEEYIDSQIEKRELKGGLEAAGMDSTGDYYDKMFQELLEGDMDEYMDMLGNLNATGVVDVSSVESAMRSRANKAEMDPDDYNDLLAAAGLKLKFEVEDMDEDRYSIDDLTMSQYTDFVGERGDLVDDIISEFDRRGFGSLDKETANALLSAAYSFAAETALERASGGEYESDTKWINLAQEADEIGLTAAEYIMLKEEYSAGAIAADGLYEAYDATGMDAALYLEMNKALGDIKADKNAAGKTITDSRKRKVQDYLNSMGLTYEEYLWMMGREYSSIKKSAEYKSVFGG